MLALVQQVHVLASASARLMYCSTINSDTPSAAIRSMNSKIALTTSGARPERRLVDEHELRVRDVRAHEGEHLLFTPAEGARDLALPVAEHGERVDRPFERLALLALR